jgi:hypothetical protein
MKNAVWILNFFLAWNVAILADTHYVAPPGVGVNPSNNYTNWSIAATSIQDAVNVAVAPDTVLVSNGVYKLTNQVYISTGIRILSWNNGDVDRDGTIIDGNNYAGKLVTNRCFQLNHVDALVRGFTITGGVNVATANNQHLGGGGVYIFVAGTLQDCLVTGNMQTNASESGGAGAYAQGVAALITNCDFIANLSYNRAGGVMVVDGARMWNCRVMYNEARGTMGGGAVLVSGAAGPPYVYNTLIVSNRATTGCYGGGVGMRERGVIRNCLIMANTSDSSFGGGIGNWGGGGDSIVENCTIVTNTGRGIYKGWWTSTVNFRNTIVYDNTVGQFADTSGGYYSFTNSCISQTGLNGAGNITNVSPQFADAAGRNYRLTVGSPCANAGLNQSWMDGSADLDNRSRKDRFSGLVDIGCYEYLPRGIMFKMY